MKLVQLLAKELKEWPENSTWCSQDDDKEIRFEMVDGDFFASELADDHGGVGDGERVTKAQWQAEREKMNKPKWIRHRGRNRCVDDDVFVEVKLRCGDVQRGEAKDFIWSHHCCDSAVNIMAYRVIEETKDQEIEEVKVSDVKLEMMRGDSWVTIGRVAPDFGASVFDGDQLPKDEEVKDTNLGTLTYKLEIDATEAAKEIDSLVAKWGQIESPLKWRDEIIELEAYEEEFRREREKLIRKLESEGFKLIDHMAPIYGEQIIDVSDWRNWQAGDVIEIVANEGGHQFENGEEVIVSRLDINDIDMSVKAKYKDGSDYWWLSGKDAKFIRRP